MESTILGEQLMSEEKYERLSLSEYELIGRALFELLADCPELPEGVPLKYQTKEKGESLSFMTFDSKRTSQNVHGGFTGEVNFQIAYKSFPTTNGQRINAQSVVDKIMKWLEEVRNYPLLTDDRTITKISVSSSEPFTDSGDTDGNVVFAANAVMEYEAE